jgi:predicted dehydrogenase
VLRFSGGGLSTIAATNCAVPGEWNGLFCLVCERLVARFDSPDTAELIFTAGRRVRRERIADDTDFYLEDTNRFISTIRGEAHTACPIEEGLASLRLVTAVVRSAAHGGRPTRIPSV